jgi:hypothetical protein
MNERDLKKLMDAARRETPPVPPPDFAACVMAAVRREPHEKAATLWEQLDRLFPRLAIAAAAVMAVCALADICQSALYPSNLIADLNEISEQWLVAANGGANE